MCVGWMDGWLTSIDGVVEFPREHSREIRLGDI